MTTINQKEILKFASYNVHGIKNCNWAYLNEIVNIHDFVLIQEHWLHSSQFHLISDKIRGVSVACTSGMSDHEHIQGRPYGGCAIIWRNTLRFAVEPIACVSSRICAVKVSSCDLSFMLFTLYMPCDTEVDETNNDLFRSILRELNDLSVSLNIDFVVCGGDFNCDLSRFRSLHTQSLLEFINNENFELIDRMPLSQISFTYESMSNQSRSKIDHFMLTQNMCDLVESMTCDLSPDNTSDHNVISLTLNMYAREVVDREVSRRVGIRWADASLDDIALYAHCLDLSLDSIPVPMEAFTCRAHNCSAHSDEISLFHDAVIDACLTAADASIPKIKSKRSVPGWNEFVRPLREQAMFWHQLWKSNDCPRIGIIADIRRRTRAQYHRVIRQVRRHEEELRSTRMAEKFGTPNKRDFWGEVKRIRGGRVSNPTSIDDVCGEEGIAGVFSNKYEALYRSVPFDHEQLHGICRDLEETIVSHPDDACHKVSVDNVKYAVAKLKGNKHDGNKGVFTNHIIHGPQKLYLYMSLLFDCMIRHYHVPVDFSLSTLIPIPKNKKKSLNNADNYRAVALSSIMGKIVDHILLVNCAEAFSTSDHQFGFKAKHSTSMCTFIVNEVMNNFNRKNTNVFCTLLDASKAFDRVEFVMLFRSLIKKGICPIVCRFLVNLYTSQLIRVKWGETYSDPSGIQNGVKQGGVMSPVLFSVYLDDLLLRLSKLRVGCHIDNKFMGAFGYADDLVLLAPSLNATKTMLKACEQYADEYNIIFNPQKSKMIVKSNIIVKSKTNDQIQNLSFMGGNIEIVENDKHLGNIIGNVQHKELVQSIITDFKRRVNMLKFNFPKAPPHVIYALFKSFCMPLYGAQLLELGSRDLERFYTAWRKAIRYLLNLPLRTHSRYLPWICRDQPIKVQLYKRFIKFYQSLFNSSNLCCKCCYALVVNGTRSHVSNSLSLITENFQISRRELNNIDVSKISSTCPDEDQMYIQAINELLLMRTNFTHTAFLNVNECNIFLNFLCCN